MRVPEEDRVAMVGGAAFLAVLVPGLLWLNLIPLWAIALPLGLVVLAWAATLLWATRQWLTKSRRRETPPTIVPRPDQ